MKFLFYSGLCLSYTMAEAQSKPIKAKVSYYADYFHGRRTANGEIFNMHKMTAAHKNLPFGTILRVTNTENNKSVLVRINDRGPYVRGRELDLSLGAAKQIGIASKGVASVLIEAVNNQEEYEQYVASLVSEDYAEPAYTQQVALLNQTSKRDMSNSEEIRLLASASSQVYIAPPTTESQSNYLLKDRLSYVPDGTFTVGKAFVYPDSYEGKKMKNGKPYLSSNYTCAHNKYPVGRILKVTRKDNPDLSVVVEVTDSQPIQDYDIQLSWTAASDLELFNYPQPQVIIEEISVTDLDALPEPNSLAESDHSIEISFLDKGSNMGGEEKESPTPAPSPLTLRSYTPVPEELDRSTGVGLYQIEARKTNEEGYGVQIAIYTQYRDVLAMSEKLFEKGIQNTLIHSDVISNGQEVLRFIVGPFDNKKDADQMKAFLDKEQVQGSIIRLEPLGVR